MSDYDITQTYDGVWRSPPRKHFYRSCCDCGLVHREEYRVRNGRVQYRVWRDRAETRLERRRTGKDRKTAKFNRALLDAAKRIDRLETAIKEARNVAEMDDLPQWVEHFDKALGGDGEAPR